MMFTFRVNLPPKVQTAVVLEMDQANSSSNGQKRRFSAASRVSSKSSSLLRRTPISITRRNSKSLQDISGPSLAKQLLTERKISLASYEKSLVSIQSSPANKVPMSAATIITVAPTDSEEEMC